MYNVDRVWSKSLRDKCIAKSIAKKAIVNGILITFFTPPLVSEIRYLKPTEVLFCAKLTFSFYRKHSEI